MKKYRALSVFSITAALASPCLFATSYVQTNLVVDTTQLQIQYNAVMVDPNLTNPWGISFSSTSPFWVSNQASGTSTLYNGAGTKTAITVTVGPTTPTPAGPTGQVQNSAGAGNFMVNGTAASFIFDTLNGTIAAWNNVPTGNMTAATLATTAGAVYTGLALANNGSGNFLYAANFTNGGGINVFNSSFAPTTLSGNFTDPNLPAGYAPYNIQLIGNNLYVEYAQVGSTPGSAARGAGLGFVDVFDLNGNYIQRLVSGSALNAPWGVVIAPPGFGQFSNDLLVGNFGNGEINAFDPNTGTFLGTLDLGNGSAIVNQDLWALEARPNGGSGSVANAVYFDAGIDAQKDGLFGYIAPAPEPAVYELGLCGFLIVGVLAWRKRRSAD